MGAPQCWAHTSRFALMRQRVIDAKAKNQRMTWCREFFKNDSLLGDPTKKCRELHLRGWGFILVAPPPVLWSRSMDRLIYFTVLLKFVVYFFSFNTGQSWSLS